MSYYDWPETNSVTFSPAYGGDSYDYYEIALQNSRHQSYDYMYSLEPEKKYDQFMGELTDNPVRTYKDDILICIFNYRNDDIAKKWLHMLQPFFDVYVLDSGNIHEEKEFMQFPNIYYSGLFNEMKKLSERKRYKFIGMIPSDITLMCEPSLLIDRIKWLMLTCNIGLWQPSLDVDSRPWADNFHSNGPELLSKKVLEGHFLFMKSDVLKAVDYINLSENKFGYGISEIICGLSMKLGYGNVFDNTLQIHHPNDTGYSMTSAAKESKNWTPVYCEKYGLDYSALLDIQNGHNTYGEFNVRYHYNADKITYTGKKKHPVFVSITSWKKRLQYVPKMIDNLKKQTVQPDKVFLWLSSDEIRKDEVPQCLYDDPYVDIMWVDKNLYVWKRFMTVRQFPDAFVLMMDDDLYYHRTYIEEMLGCSQRYGNSGIICYSCNWCNSKGEPWGNISGASIGRYWLSGGVTLWCPGSFPMEAFDRYDDIMGKYELQCDECYLMPFVYYHNTPIHTVEDDWSTFYDKTKAIDDSQNSGLFVKFFEPGEGVQTNKKNRLLQEIVSQLDKPYRDSFKQKFPGYEPISELFPENNK